MAKGDSLKYFAKSSKDIATSYMETGNIALDMITTNGKGLPIGGYVVLVASHGSGKTTSCADIIKRLIMKHKQLDVPFKAMYIDMEGSQELMRSMGLAEFIDSGDLYYKYGPTTFEEMDQIAQDIESGDLEDVKLLIIDSVSQITCANEKSSDSGDYGFAIKARNRFYKIFLARLKMLGVTCLGISQVRQKQGATQYEDPYKAALATGDLHYADIILKLSKSTGGNNAETKKIEIATTTSDKKVKKNTAFLVTYKIYDDKNRFGNFPEQTTLFQYGKGADNWYIMHKMLTYYKYLVNKGSASFPKYVMDSDLVNFVGKEFPENSDKKTMKAYLRENVTALKDFLKSRDEYVSEQVVAVEDDD